MLMVVLAFPSHITDQRVKRARVYLLLKKNICELVSAPFIDLPIGAKTRAVDLVSSCHRSYSNHTLYLLSAFPLKLLLRLKCDQLLDPFCDKERLGKEPLLLVLCENSDDSQSAFFAAGSLNRYKKLSTSSHVRAYSASAPASLTSSRRELHELKSPVAAADNYKCESATGDLGSQSIVAPFHSHEQHQPSLHLFNQHLLLDSLHQFNQVPQPCIHLEVKSSMAAVQLDASELQQIALRQQKQIDAQNQELRLKEARVMQFRQVEEQQRRHLTSVSVAQQRHFSELQLRVAQQEERLRRLRGAAEQLLICRSSNDSLGKEVEVVKRKFWLKEKELSDAVRNCEELIKKTSPPQHLFSIVNHTNHPAADVDKRLADLRLKVEAITKYTKCLGEVNSAHTLLGRNALSGSKDDLALLPDSKTYFDKSDPKYRSAPPPELRHNHDHPPVPREGESVRGFIVRQSTPTPGRQANQRQVQYAPRSVIADTYTGRASMETLERYKRTAADLLQTRLLQLNLQDPPGAPPSASSLRRQQQQPTSADAATSLVDKVSTRLMTTPRAVHRKHSSDDYGQMENPSSLTRLFPNLVSESTNQQLAAQNAPPSALTQTPFTQDIDSGEVMLTQSELSGKVSDTLKVQDSFQPSKSCLKRCTSARLPSDCRKVYFDPLAVLLDAALEGELALVEECISKMPNVSAANDEGITALHNAICAGHKPVVELLVRSAADVNAADADGWTPLHCAASCNSLSLVQLLIENGAAIFARTLSDHESPLDKCEDEDNTCCADYLYAAQEKLGIVNSGIVFAVFEYKATHSDELTIALNDKLTIVRKGDVHESEWYWAENALSGKCGYVARNFVALFPRILPGAPPPSTKLSPTRSPSTDASLEKNSLPSNKSDVVSTFPRRGTNFGEKIKS